MRRFYSWARTEHCTPASFEQPTCEAQLVRIVCEARSANKQVEVIGARHSWSDIAMPCERDSTDCMLVSLDAMQAVLEVDPARGRVRVQAGIRLHRLNDALAKRGLALSIVGSVVEQSLAGVLSTGTHGSSLVHGNIPSFVVGLRVITGTGEVLEIHEHDPLLAAARVGLGGLGIITQVSGHPGHVPKREGVREQAARARSRRRVSWPLARARVPAGASPRSRRAATVSYGMKMIWHEFGQSSSFT
ncbi:FAD-binding protein [Enhygromyxa salina]|uniref:FAD-binding protein n=1 Tax=Enhygromyxa salina TaxID=215803 RepID=UPI0011BAD9AA|nr:FAD-binding protein [Enhygromyxa salina]